MPPRLRPGPALALVWLTLVGAAALLPSWFTALDPLAVAPAERLSGPSPAHPLGTDQLGRDLFARVVHGAGASLTAAALATLVGLVAGGVFGLLAGFLRGPADALIMRLMDMLLSIPGLLLSLALIAVLGPGTRNVAVAVGVTGIAAFARITRAEVLRVREEPFVEAARAGGARLPRVLLRHVLPNSLGPVRALAALDFAGAILAVSALSFLGYGVQPPHPEWGALVSEGRDALRTAWWLTTFPGLAVVVTVVAANRVSRALEGGLR
ncbi:ABC transporter permease [Actinocorallia sp. A-T 12471]|uniref:ABC transporter permease n=1 Tax=Actinocorallia sp. A-T 12471 TaxID=3089813 RepID=UPI0029D15DED|nr:ABC transporter permease [Actinocorallia sp. A-T 12471]MDX6740670.1 ABC transporter permease [Actinocorallia sp. A-T 12471]